MDRLASVLLRRRNLVALPGGGAEPGQGAADEGWVRSLETDLVERGWLLSAELRAALAGLDRLTRLSWSDWLLAAADESVGADRDHVPLFRTFPDVPDSLDSLYVDLLLAHLFQAPEAPCVLCGAAGEVRPLAPCGHLICAACFAPERFAGCPACGRRVNHGLIGSDQQFLEPRKPRKGKPGPVVRWTRIGLTADADALAVLTRDELVTRPQPLSPEDGADLAVLISATAPGSLDWLPAGIGVRENLARALATGLLTARPDTAADLAAEVAERWTTATDIARTLWTYSGGEPGLTLPKQPEPDKPASFFQRLLAGDPVVAERTTRLRAIPRWLRRAALARLDSFDLPTAGEDLARHATVWKRLAERLHPFEATASHPRAAVCFAALRGTRTPMDSPLGLAIEAAAAEHPERVLVVRHPDGRIGVRILTHASLVERALADGDAGRAIDLLSSRPGELWRRLDQLSGAVGDDPDLWARLLAAASTTAGRVAPGVLGITIGHLARRTTTVKAEPVEEVEATASTEVEAVARPARRGLLAVFRRRGDIAARRAAAATAQRPARPEPPAPNTPRRVFLPSGDVVRLWTAPERRDPLPSALVGDLVAAGRAELVRRAGRLTPYDLVVVDAALAEVPAPTREQASSGQLAGWTRGSRVALPEHDGLLRLFLHWTDSPVTRVDLDLSCTFYADDWTPLGHCDYTRLRWRQCARHSGDLTSAPPPGGATEYIDLELDALRAEGVRWVVPVVFSFNDVAFEHLDRAISGFMLPQRDGEAFQPERVAQRFDLRGRSRALLPMVADLAHESLLWADVNLATTGYGHSVARSGAALGRLAADIWEFFGSGERVSAFDLVALHALGRAPWLRVVHSDGSVSDVRLEGDPEEAMARIRLALEGRHSEAGAPGEVARALVAAVRESDLLRVADSVRVGQFTGLVAVGEPGDGTRTVHDLLAELSAAAP